MVLILKEPALGMAMLCVPTLFAVLFIAGARKRHLLGIVAIALALMPAGLGAAAKMFPAMGTFPFSCSPISGTASKPWSFPIPTWITSRNAPSSPLPPAARYGKGLGCIPLGQHVPEAKNDMIFALIGEQLGFFGSVIVAAALPGFVHRRR